VVQNVSGHQSANFYLSKTNHRCCQCHAFAGGLITALRCDHRIGVMDDTLFSLNEVPIGIPMPSVYTEIIRHAIGTRAASNMILSGRIIGAQEALALGILHENCNVDELMAGAMRYAKYVPADSFAAFEFSKKAVQAQALHQIGTIAVILSEGSRRMHRKTYQKLKGKPLE
jgi:enoyl-CoA hydratase